MKKYLLILVMLVGITTGCKLDDSTVPKNVSGNSIVGMWYLKSMHTVGTSLGIPVDGTAAGTAKDYYLFKADGKVDVSTEDDGVSSGTYTYDTASRKLTITQGLETNSITITSLTADAMVLTFPISVPALSTSLTITATYSR